MVDNIDDTLEPAGQQLVLQMQPILLTVEESARVLSISVRALVQATTEGEIAYCNVGTGTQRHQRRYLVEDLVAWARRRREAGKASS